MVATSGRYVGGAAVVGECQKHEIKNVFRDTYHRLDVFHYMRTRDMDKPKVM